MPDIQRILRLVKKQVSHYTIPSVTKVSFNKDPYRVLISCILSLRTKDRTTVEASRRLFQIAPGARAMVKLTTARISRLIYPVGFYRTKARVIREISERLIREYSGKVPADREDLLDFKGVGKSR